ncbi:NAD(P)H-binding protein [Streptomyces sp. Je 1-4]|uniref:NmrA family NAD(P)-binding protein n=1 Tax=Streptomyces TaxID=1883 RepID=UPI0021D8FC78|nr:MULTISPECIES: NAD(P)H-binding protein [unclassified Streptomyces]UYB38382.1 NAD(P)H-binding protein [Streptomyces sp. Je 1-4]UZQ34337.1 NAD(P)H-binding protein [Streptomyces sp. Je 1-4] [Streptomyces sp. Je 1-4 4N24]UZQ41755.1 NAD(P)H-binding protein [Streptomyces sp. Je 1-4] [Streptomyces sp. Je 1-4 4N24_ara]
MQIAVTTPTGNVGRHVVATLVRAGVRPRVLVRDPARLAPDVRDEVDAVPVDQYDADAVVAATEDVDALFWVDPVTGSADPLADHARATGSVVRAVTENRIGRVVFQSSVGAEKRQGAGEIDGLAHTETALDDLGVDVTHLRCGYFFTNLELQLDALRAGTLQVILPLDHPMAWVAPRDIAEVAATRLLSPTWSGRCVQAVHGPADLTWRQVGTILTAATGRRISVEQITDDAMRTQLHQVGMPDSLVEAMLGMSTGLRENFVPEQRRTVRTTTPTTLAAWAYDRLRHRIDEAS